MAIQLTTNWQNIAYAVYQPGTGFRATFYLDAKYSVQSIANNNTTIQVRLNSVVESGSASGYGYDFGLSYANGVSGSNLWTIETETITSGEAIIQHNDDGTKTLNLSAYANVYGLGMYLSMNGDVKLPDIARYPLIIQAPDFNDEENPTITYTTSLGFPGSTIEAGIFNSDGDVAYANYRQINLEDGSYTFNLTATERNTLRNATPNSKTMNVKYIIRTTTTNNVNYYSESIRTLTIINGTPIYTHSEEEINPKVIELLGTNAGNTIIQNASILRTTVVPSAKKGATINYVRVACGSSYIEYKTSSPYQFDIPSNSLASSFTIIVKDSRGISAGDFVFKTLIEYQPVNITNLTMKRQNPTSSNVILNMEAVYFQKTFGSTANVPIVKWKVDNGNYTTIPSSEYIIDTTNNKLTISNYTLSNAIVYTSPGTITIEISDLLTSYTDSRNIIKGIATYDVGEHDLQVNGDLFVADTNRQNEVNILDEINKKANGIYSTSEYDTGKTWINGEKIYRKVIKTTGINGDNIEISHNISNLKQIIDYKIVAMDNVNAHESYFGGNAWFTLVASKTTSTKLICSISTAFDTHWPVYHIIEYIKTS